LLDHCASQLAQVVGSVYVAVRSDQLHDPIRRRYQLIVDREQGKGPASGLLAAHEQFPDLAWLVIACDMPCLTVEALRRLRDARDCAAAATAFRSTITGKPEPLCAIYEPATLAAFRVLVLSGGDPSPLAFLATCNLRLLHPDNEGLLANVNTPAELERLEATADDEGEETP
jgi:molybdopterin-guanine dinucleotide biosynthesis protein A